MENGIFEQRTDKTYRRFDLNAYCKWWCYKREHGIENKWEFGGSGSETRTYDKLPKHKRFDFLRKAFEECPWSKIKKFRFIDTNKECFVDSVFWDFDCCGYVLKILYHFPASPDFDDVYSIATVKDINCIEPIDYVFDMNLIEILEEID
jgi:hypothetical protein